MLQREDHPEVLLEIDASIDKEGQPGLMSGDILTLLVMC
jgi:hypothetical protein